ncbi:response regulator [Paenibacillaceae bacterium]|nr:response regulator [Paenibacillaceae bacterium]
MRYKVFVVDDEPMIRYGLVSCVAWEEEGLQLLGEAANGEAALSRLSVEMADILITDIKMPLMDGLELIRHVKLLHPHIQVILVSSYSDFEYAREAVKLGVVVDYLLKPTMEPEDLLAIVRTCKARLDESGMHRQQQDQQRDNAERTRLHKLKSELKAWLGKTGEPLSWMPTWMNEPLITAVWRQTKSAPAGEQPELERVLLLETAMEKCAEWIGSSLSFIAGEQEFIQIIADGAGGGFALVEQAHQRLLTDAGLGFTVGVSPVFHHIKAFPDACRWAKYACEESFFEGQGRCYRGRIQLQDQEAGDTGGLKLAWDPRFTQLREAFSHAYAEADQAAGKLALGAVYEVWRERQYSRSGIMSQAQSLLTIMWSRNYKLKSEQMMKEIIDKLQQIHRIDTLAELIGGIESEYERQWDVGAVALIPDDTSGAHLIQLALSYIQENYRTELSLQKVADHVHMSKNYFSEQFKRRTGLNYIDFVIRLRIHYARQLLVSTSLKIHDIGMQSGFNSPKHFLKLFKREVGCTPAEYRQKQAWEEAQHSRGGR